MANFAQEIIEDILLRLPGKSLSKFRYVSKQWLSLISSGEFIKSHLEKTRLQGIDKHIVKVSLVQDPEEFKFYYIDHESPVSINDRDSTGAAASLYIPQLNDDKLCFHYIIGSCDGLLCMFLTKKRRHVAPTQHYTKRDTVFVVWNPCTREYLQLPCPVSYYESPYSFNGQVYGFGFTSSANDYKIIIGEIRWPDCAMHVVSLKSSNSWRRLRIRSGCYELQHIGVVLNGAVHWPIMTVGIKLILAFDLEQETMTEFRVPACIDIQFDKSIVFGGLLSLTTRIGYYYRSDICEVWSMKEYGIAESWMKVLSVSVSISDDIIPYVGPWCYSESGEIVMWIHGGDVVRYNLKDGVCRRLELGDLKVCSEKYEPWLAYQESILSPKSLLSEMAG